MLTTLIDIVHIFVCVFLMLVVLLQQGKGGGMGAAFGGGAAQQVFGGRGAGNILTRATAICAAIFMLTSVSLAYLSSSGDRDLRQRVLEEQHKKGRGNEGTPRAPEELLPGVKGAPGTSGASSGEPAPAAPEQPIPPQQ
jgi:preprotein translocase subunit SecG